jgi:acyl carrier protein
MFLIKIPVDFGDPMAESILEKLAEYIATDFLKQPGRIIAPDEPLLTSGLIDSFHLVDLSIFVENTFGVRIDDADLNASSFDTLNQLAAFIQSHR